MFVVKVVTIFQSYHLTFYFSFSLEGMRGQNNNFGNKRVYSPWYISSSLVIWPILKHRYPHGYDTTWRQNWYIIVICILIMNYCNLSKQWNGKSALAFYYSSLFVSLSDYAAICLKPDVRNALNICHPILCIPSCVNRRFSLSSSIQTADKGCQSCCRTLIRRIVLKLCLQLTFP